MGLNQCKPLYGSAYCYLLQHSIKKKAIKKKPERDTSLAIIKLLNHAPKAPRTANKHVPKTLCILNMNMFSNTFGRPNRTFMECGSLGGSVGQGRYFEIGEGQSLFEGNVRIFSVQVFTNPILLFYIT